MSSSAASGAGVLGQGSGRPWAVPGYTELRTLGAGGFGEVVLAVHEATGTPVAIKYLKGDLLADPGFVDLFHAEATALGGIVDPHVVRLYEYVEAAPAGAAIVMEVIDGVSLAAILKNQGKTSPEAALVVLYGSLLGLAAAHASGVVHRDYKPDNVLVNGHGVSKLTDFGIAVRAGDRPLPTGTLRYMPPEQFEGAPASPAADVYAATVTFYQCLTGEVPFDGRSATELYGQHKTASVPLALVPVPLRPIVARGLAKNPLYRPANAGYLAAELRNAAAGTYGPQWEERGRSHLGKAALALALLWPSAGTPAITGSTIEQVQLTEPAPGGQQSKMSKAARHRWHVLHVLHLAHLTYLLTRRRQSGQAGTAPGTSTGTGGQAGGGTGASGGPGGTGKRKPPRPPRSRLSQAVSVVTAAAVIAAGTMVLVTSHSPTPPGPPQQGTYQESLATIPATLTSSFTPENGYTYVEYDHSGNGGTGEIKGTIKDAKPGEIARLYAQIYPDTSAPAPIATLALTPVNGSASYSFKVTPSLATRYQVKLFATGTATTPVAATVINTLYVVGNTVTIKDMTCGQQQYCTQRITFGVYFPPQAIRQIVALPWDAYLGSTPGSSPAPTTLQLGGGGATVTDVRIVSANELEYTFTFPANQANNYNWWICPVDVDHPNGMGLPKPWPYTCGQQQSIPTGGAYIG
ncbi:MAG TPA: serine/threonine-protein kinase [Trebonia sp.]